MSASHHPDDAVLAAYSAGTLKPGFDVVIAAHLERCPACRRAVALFEAAGGDLLDEAAPTAMADDALSHLLARIERPEAAPEPALEPLNSRGGSVSPPLLDTPRDHRPLAERLKLRRRRWIGPGAWVQTVDIDTEDGDRVYLLRVPGGMKGLKHSHHGPEFTLVLSGALRDGDTVFRPGDFVECDSDLTHQPSAEMDDGGCVCLIASEGGIAPADRLGRVVAALTGV